MQQLADPHVNRLIDEVTALAGQEFTARAGGSSGPPARAGIEELCHPDDQQLIVHLPADESTSARLDGLLRTGPSVVRPSASSWGTEEDTTADRSTNKRTGSP